MTGVPFFGDHSVVGRELLGVSGRAVPEELFSPTSVLRQASEGSNEIIATPHGPNVTDPGLLPLSSVLHRTSAPSHKRHVLYKRHGLIQDEITFCVLRL